MIGDFLMRDCEPVFLNEGATRAELELQKLEALESVVATEDKERLAQDIRLTRAGVAGEKKIVFELKNSHYPLVFIHDLQLEFEGTSAQVDFLVVTPYNTIAIECKNLIGNIEIDAGGSFIRTFGRGRYRRREGIYSPITQGRRHVELMKAIVRSEHNKAVNLIQHFTLDDFYHSIVVLANERSLLNADSAPDEIRSQVIRADQLLDYIRALDKRYARKNGRDSFKTMRARAERWLRRSTPHARDLAASYSIVETSRQSREVPQSDPVPQQAPAGTEANPRCPLCGSPMVLRTARRGKNKGNRFWGCSTYATNRCRGIVPYDESADGS